MFRTYQGGGVKNHTQKITFFYVFSQESIEKRTIVNNYFKIKLCFLKFNLAVS